MMSHINNDTQAYDVPHEQHSTPAKSNTKTSIARTVEDDGATVEIFVSVFRGQ